MPAGVSEHCSVVIQMLMLMLLYGDHGGCDHNCHFAGDELNFGFWTGDIVAV